MTADTGGTLAPPTGYGDRETSSLAVGACHRLRGMVLSGALAGSHAIQERRLAKQPGLSRTPVLRHWAGWKAKACCAGMAGAWRVRKFR